MSKPIPEGTPCPKCKSTDRYEYHLQGDYWQYRCSTADCNRFLDWKSIPTPKAKAKKERQKDA